MRLWIFLGLAALGAGVAWALARGRLAEIEAELDRPDLERYAAARKAA